MIIDIGLNIVCFVVYGGLVCVLMVLLNEKVIVKFGKGLFENGCLLDKVMKVVLVVFGCYVLLLKLCGVEMVEIVVIVVVCDVSNGVDFLVWVCVLGLVLWLLLGEEEVVISVMGVIGVLLGVKGVVVDLGGGSFELIYVEGG